MRSAAALLIWLFCTAIASAGAMVVVESTAPAYAPGRELSPRSIIDLDAGEQATLLFGNGRTLRVVGPYRGVLSGYIAAADGLIGQAMRASRSAPRTGGDDLAAVRGRRPAAGINPQAISALAILRARCRALRRHEAAPRPRPLHGQREAETIDAYERRRLVLRAALEMEIAALAEAVGAPPGATPPPETMCDRLASAGRP